MGRCIGEPHFFNMSSITEEKSDNKRLQNFRKAVNDASAMLAALQDSSEAPADDIIAAEYDVQRATEKVEEEMKSCAQRIQKLFGPRLLRRVPESLDYNGVPLLSLPPCVDIALFLDLKPHEVSKLQVIASDLEDRLGSSFLPILLVTELLL